MTSDWIATPLAQYGFLGFSAVLLGLVIWLIKKLLTVLDANTRVIEANTKAISDLTGMTSDLLKLNRSLHDKLISRPCISTRETDVSVIVDIAEAVKAELNGHEFSQEFTAARVYRPVFDLKDMKDLHVTVVPEGVTITTAVRGRTQTDAQVDVAVQKKVAADAESDDLMALVEEMVNFFRFRRLAQYPQAVWVGIENVPIFAPEHLAQMNQFTSVLTLTYRVIA